MSKKDWDIMTKQTKDLSPEGGIPVFSLGEVQRKGGFPALKVQCLDGELQIPGPNS